MDIDNDNEILNLKNNLLKKKGETEDVLMKEINDCKLSKKS